jgi:hypothetical protein
MAGFAMVVVVGGKIFFVKMKSDRDTKSSWAQHGVLRSHVPEGNGP